MGWCSNLMGVMGLGLVQLALSVRRVVGFVGIARPRTTSSVSATMVSILVVIVVGRRIFGVEVTLRPELACSSPFLVIYLIISHIAFKIYYVMVTSS